MCVRCKYKTSVKQGANVSNISCDNANINVGSNVGYVCAKSKIDVGSNVGYVCAKSKLMLDQMLEYVWRQIEN